MRVWQGTTPDGYGLLVERDERSACWIVTVASVSRSRNASLETALLEAGGDSVSHAWAAQLAAVAARRVADIVSERPPHSSRTGPA
jgi:hypothetical protein